MREGGGQHDTPLVESPHRVDLVCHVERGRGEGEGPGPRWLQRIGEERRR